MQIKLFTIPITGDENSTLTNELNVFLRSHRILNISKELVFNEFSNCWCFCIEYVEGAKPSNLEQSVSSKKVDYKEVLSEEDFEKFKILRESRKKVAEEAGVPAYAIFVDAQLAELSKIDIKTLSEEKLKSINGFGDKKFERFGQRFL